MPRFLKAIAQAVAASLATMFVTFVVGMWMVRNSTDGQAGMGPFFGAIYLGILVGVVVFGVSVYRSSPSRRLKDDRDSRSL